LPVGVVIVAAFTAGAGSGGQDPFNLVLGLLPGGIGVSNLFLVLSGERQASLAATRQGRASVPASVPSSTP
ncbi:MAG: large conductance mechanosensitive channel protein MscL, partial [Candidatus Bipolaricaulota bacterium]|nr:large conductance mechanosensitive channel protein MscL [Candidatus Bipolaricaulota bacterium]